MFKVIQACIGVGIIAITTQLYIATEETLVVIAFGTFIAFAYANIKESVATFFDNISDKIEDDFNLTTEIKRKQVELLLNSYKKINNSIIYLIKLTEVVNSLISTIVKNKKKALINQIKLDIKEKFKNVVEVELQLIKSTQKKIIPLITKNVFIKNKAILSKIKTENLAKIDSMTIPSNITKQKEIVLLSKLTSIPVSVLKLISIYKIK